MGKHNSAKPGFIILVCGIMGVILAALMQLAYENEWLLDLYLSSTDELLGLQIIFIILFLMIGAILGALSS